MGNKRQDLETSLDGVLKAGETLELNEDTFLTNDLDGSDKIYGFTKDEDGSIMVDNGSSGYPIDEMVDEDLNYIFNGSKITGDTIFNKLLAGKYFIDSL
jgi:hypothetical protein